MSTKPVRFGLIGYGAWGGHHARALAKTAGAELVAICARSEESCARARGDYPNARVYPSYAELLRQEELDAVDIVLPSHLHHEVARAVLESGRHLLMEKPMALTVEHCEDLIALAQRQGKVLAIGHEMRLSSLWGKVIAMTQNGAIGAPLHVLIELWRRPYRLGAEGWRYDIGRVGNWILEEPIHFFDLARCLLAGVGEPLSVYARANSRQVGHPELQDNFSAVINYPEGVYAVISQTLAGFQHHQVVKVTGTKGALWANWGGEMDRTFHPVHSLKYHNGSEVQDIPIERASGEVFELEDEMAMMVRAIRAGMPVAATGTDGRHAVAMCLAAQRSVESGKIEGIAIGG